MKLFLGVAAACLAAVLQPAEAQEYPNKPIHMLIGYPPGGVSDIVGRLVAQELSRMNDQTVVVENKPGVGGMLAMSMLTKAPADGYTIGLGVSGSMVIGPQMVTTPLYDGRKEFEYVGVITKSPMVLVVGADSKYDSIKALVSDAKARPGEIMYASGAQAFEMAFELFKSKAGIQMSAVNYAGGAAAVVDVIGGRVPMAIDTIGAQIGNINAGKLRPLAVLDTQRSAMLPNVPTMIEAGVPDYQAVGWTSLVVPKGTPAPIIAKLSQQLSQITTATRTRERIVTLGFEPWSVPLKDMSGLIDDEYTKWGDLIKSAGIALR